MVTAQSQHSHSHSTVSTVTEQSQHSHSTVTAQSQPGHSTVTAPPAAHRSTRSINHGATWTPHACMDPALVHGGWRGSGRTRCRCTASIEGIANARVLAATISIYSSEGMAIYRYAMSRPIVLPIVMPVVPPDGVDRACRGIMPWHRIAGSIQHHCIGSAPDTHGHQVERITRRAWGGC